MPKAGTAKITMEMPRQNRCLTSVLRRVLSFEGGSFSVTLSAPTDCDPRVSGHFVCLCTRGAFRGAILS